MNTQHPKYPIAGDIYSSALYQGETCKVVRVSDGVVTFQWLGDHAYIDEQRAHVNQFVNDFQFVRSESDD